MLDIACHVGGTGHMAGAGWLAVLQVCDMVQGEASTCTGAPDACIAIKLTDAGLQRGDVACSCRLPAEQCSAGREGAKSGRYLFFLHRFFCMACCSVMTAVLPLL